MHTPGTPSIGRLRELGVGRITFGVDLYITALSAVESAARALRDADIDALERSQTLSAATLAAVMGSARSGAGTVGEARNQSRAGGGARR